MGSNLKDFNPKARAQLLANDAVQNAKQLTKNNPRLGAVEAGVAESTIAPTLERRPPKQRSGKNRVEIVIILLACVHRELDSDNLQGSLKPCRDAIAVTIGIDDGDPRLRWEYAQVVTRGEEGVIVKIERLNL